MRTHLPLVPIVVALVACSSATAPGTSLSATGTWIGDSNGSAFSFTLMEGPDYVAGFGHVVSGADTLAMVVQDGSRSDTKVSLSLSASDGESLQLAGTLSSPTSLAATISVPSAVGWLPRWQVVLERQ